MYIEKYWDNYIGGTDDSLTLLDYLIDKQKTEISLSEIFADTSLDKLNWDFHKTEIELGYKDHNGRTHEFDFAKNSLSYELHEMVPNEGMQEIAQACESLRKELYE